MELDRWYGCAGQAGAWRIQGGGGLFGDGDHAVGRRGEGNSLQADSGGGDDALFGF